MNDKKRKMVVITDPHIKSDNDYNVFREAAILDDS